MKQLLCTVLLLAAVGVRAQQMTAEEQSEAIRRLTAEVEDLKAQTASLKKEQTTRDRLLKALPRISGYMQFRYTREDERDDFSFRRVRLALDGAVAPALDYKIQLELSHFKLLDAYVDYKPFAQFKVRAGQFKIPFSIENTAYFPRDLELQDYPMALQQLAGFAEVIGADKNINKSAGRETGIALRGDFFGSILSYDLALFNGAGINEGDNNRAKDFVGRLTIRPVEGLLLSTSHYEGRYDKQHYARRRTSFGACYDRGPVVARSEYFLGKTGYDGYELDSDGCYVLLGWRFRERWLAAVRYDTFTRDTDRRSESRQTNCTCGLTWEPFRYLRLQADYEHQKLPVRHDNLLKLQVTASF